MSTKTIDADLADALGGYSVSSIDGKTQGNTTIFTSANAGPLFYPVHLDFILSTVTGLGTPPIMNVGWTSANYTDLINGQAFANNLTTQGDYFRVNLGTAANAVPVPANTAVVCRVSTAALATTTYTLKVIIRGYYL